MYLETINLFNFLKSLCLEIYISVLFIYYLRSTLRQEILSYAKLLLHHPLYRVSLVHIKLSSRLVSLFLDSIAAQQCVARVKLGWTGSLTRFGKRVGARLAELRLCKGVK